MGDRLFGCHSHRYTDHHYVIEKRPQEGLPGGFIPGWQRQLLGLRYLPYNLVEGCRVGAVQRVDGYVLLIAAAAKAEVGQDTHSHDRAAHASPDDMPYTTSPDFSRLCLHLL